MSPRDVVVISSARTAIGEFMGGLSSLTAVQLGIVAAKEAINRAGISPEIIDEVLTGNVYKDGLKGNPARQIQLAVGIPKEACATTIEQQCASSMRALEVGMHSIQLGLTDVALITGIESMSNVPYLDLNRRRGVKMGTTKLEDGLLYDALLDAFDGLHVGYNMEKIVAEYGITRQDIDEYALLSQNRAIQAWADGVYKDEIVPVEIKTRKGVTVIDTDEHPRQTTIEKLASLKPAFRPDGIVTAGNASGMNDAASAMIIMSAQKAEELGLKPVARILSTATMGVAPDMMGIGPIYAIPKAVERAGLKMEDIQYHEINEAFAVQVLACQRTLGISLDDLNVSGSGISLGHPVGATALRLVMATIRELGRRGQKYGCASLCAGGGPAMAVVVELL